MFLNGRDKRVRGDWGAISLLVGAELWFHSVQVLIEKFT